MFCQCFDQDLTFVQFTQKLVPGLVTVTKLVTEFTTFQIIHISLRCLIFQFIQYE